ncbi:hypothetical protein [Methanococcoides burtonii]|uniref:Glycosyltransferase RgtA/B/C/D-like domain-containing protein n=1 Tax=Methanococcoides burtonii (strain DSM 6242 / NBRC 107633 / OCM 468 / ACE-M) TaxID=259564 RepID=Q12XY8_METBU|nr:hypothetical protein [Methanococcoides burtonii]ABE51688.1 Hypothetical protein Mbur_0723 [Methanococcoides burtonii DSM 6242]
MKNLKIANDVSLLVSKKTQATLLSLLLLLNFVIRIPSIPHEKGYDSFFIHTLANSITINGTCEWWINWLSVFGLYPYSYASAVPFMLSEIAQMTGLEMEKAILVYCIIAGLLGMFTSYLLAGQIYNDFKFKYIMSLFFSLAPGVMVFTTWEVSTRGLFIVLFPFFIYLLLRIDKTIKKYILLTICFVLLFATHHYAYFLIPVIVVYFSLNILKKVNIPHFKKNHLNYIFSFAIIALILVPFFERSLVESGSRYAWLIDALITNIRYTGPALILAFGGLVYLLQKKKSFNEIIFLSLLILFLPTIYSLTYGPYFLVLFIVFLASISFGNILNSLAIHKNKLFALFVISIIVFSVAFSSFYNHNRTGDSESYWYMPHETYTAGIWGKNYIPDNSYGLDTAFETGRLFAISEGHPITPSLGPGNLAYGFIDKNDIQYTKNSPFSKQYYFDGPYSSKGSTYSGRVEWLRQYGKNIEDLEEYTYFVEDKYYYKPIVNIIHSESNKIYDATRIALWEIDVERK